MAAGSGGATPSGYCITTPFLSIVRTDRSASVSYAESLGGVLAVVALVVVSVCILARFDAAKVGGLRYCLHMAFAIQWTGPLGPATTERDEAAAALVSAMNWQQRATWTL